MVRTEFAQYDIRDIRSNLWFATYLGEESNLNHEDVMTNKGLIARELKAEENLIWAELKEGLRWRLSPNTPQLWIKHEEDSLKLIYDGDGHFVLLVDQKQALTAKDSIYLSEFKAQFPGEVQEGLNSFQKLFAYARHQNFRTDINKMEAINDRMGAPEKENWVFSTSRNYFGVRSLSGNIAYGY